MTSERDPFVDAVRSFSLVVVVIWHWAFTILVFRDDGPHATSPLRFTTGLWALTWLLQVMPLFFFVGGFAHRTAWAAAREKGRSLGGFVRSRLTSLLIPVLVLVSVWVVVGVVATVSHDDDWVWRMVRMVLSPLWFMAVYVMLIVLLPAALWLHRRYDILVLVWLAGGAMAVDVARFHYGLTALGWLNMVLVWGLAHQAGLVYDRLVALDRRHQRALLWIGLFGLAGLVGSGIYPGSMVGVPGEKFSNMAPPTFVMVALLVFQIGAVLLSRSRVLASLEHPRTHRAVGVISAYALPLFLFHSTGMAISRYLLYRVEPWRLHETVLPTWRWWVSRPIAILGSLAFTLPVIWAFRRIPLVRGGRRAGSAAPAAGPQPAPAEPSRAAPAESARAAPAESARAAPAVSARAAPAVSSHPDAGEVSGSGGSPPRPPGPRPTSS